MDSTLRGRSEEVASRNVPPLSVARRRLCSRFSGVPLGACEAEIRFKQSATLALFKCPRLKALLRLHPAACESKPEVLPLCRIRLPPSALRRRGRLST